MIGFSLAEIQQNHRDEVTERIAQNVARLVPDGATLQLGIGRMPDAVLSLLGNKNDLGIHTEMISDGIVDLVQSGAVTGSRKTLDKGKVVADGVEYPVGRTRIFSGPFVLKRGREQLATAANGLAAAMVLQWCGVLFAAGMLPLRLWA